MAFTWRGSEPRSASSSRGSTGSPEPTDAATADFEPGSSSVTAVGGPAAAGRLSPGPEAARELRSILPASRGSARRRKEGGRRRPMAGARLFSLDSPRRSPAGEELAAIAQGGGQISLRNRRSSCRCNECRGRAEAARNLGLIFAEGLAWHAEAQGVAQSPCGAPCPRPWREASPGFFWLQLGPRLTHRAGGPNLLDDLRASGPEGEDPDLTDLAPPVGLGSNRG